MKKQEIENLQQQIASLQTQISHMKYTADSLTAQNKDLQAKLELAQKEQVDSVANCSFEVDFVKLNAVSIERCIESDGDESTMVGYLNNGVIREWYFQCSRETHNRLAQEFSDSKMSPN